VLHVYDCCRRASVLEKPQAKSVFLSDGEGRRVDYSDVDGRGLQSAE